MNSVRTLVLLKYKILTSNSQTWHPCETYSPEVREAWAWRCALDVEHLATGYKEAEECIAVAKKVRDGLATTDELSTAYYATFYAASTIHAAYQATQAAYSAYQAAQAAHAAYQAAQAAHAAYSAAYSAARVAQAGYALDPGNASGKWNQYIEWLIEELCIWEEKQ